jgi:hypothetical protein
MIVENVSPTPFSLLRRAKNFEYRDDDWHLQESRKLVDCLVLETLDWFVDEIHVRTRRHSSVNALTEYPPETPTLLQVTTTKVVMIVENVSPTPFSLLRDWFVDEIHVRTRRHSSVNALTGSS